MFALVENNQFIKTVNANKGITINNIQHPKAIFTKWTKAQREAVGIYEVVIDNTNLKDQEYYINTDISYSFSNGVVTGSYGTPTAKNLNDTLWTAQDQTDGLLPEDKSVGDVKVQGLKNQKIDIIKQQASGLLTPTDWYVIKANEVEGYSVPSEISTYRAAVRTASNDMETKINNASDVDALKALFTYTNTGTEEEPVITRPLGEFPKEVI